MNWLVRFGKFWWDFIVGDDWLAAVGVVCAIVLTLVLTHNGVNAWWMMPVAGLGILHMTVRRATR